MPGLHQERPPVRVRIFGRGNQNFTGQQMDCALSGVEVNIDGAVGIEYYLRAVAQGYAATLADGGAIVGRPASPRGLVLHHPAGAAGEDQHRQRLDCLPASGRRLGCQRGVGNRGMQRRRHVVQLTIESFDALPCAFVVGMLRAPALEILDGIGRTRIALQIDQPFERALCHFTGNGAGIASGTHQFRASLK